MNFKTKIVVRFVCFWYAKWNTVRIVGCLVFWKKVEMTKFSGNWIEWFSVFSSLFLVFLRWCVVVDNRVELILLSLIENGNAQRRNGELGCGILMLWVRQRQSKIILIFDEDVYLCYLMLLAYSSADAAAADSNSNQQ